MTERLAILSRSSVQEPEQLNLPRVFRDTNGNIVWGFIGNGPEENEQLRIQNLQGLFLEQFPEFTELFPFDTEGKIVEESREYAGDFILKVIGRRADFRRHIGHSPLSETCASDFERSHIVAISKFSASWGIQIKELRPSPALIEEMDLAEVREDEEGWVTRKYLRNKYNLDTQTVTKRLDGVTRRRGKDTTGRNVILFFEDEFAEKIKDISELRDLPKADTETRRYTDKDGESWISARAFRDHYGIHNVTLATHLKNARWIVGRGGDKQETKLFNERDLLISILEKGMPEWRKSRTRKRCRKQELSTNLALKQTHSIIETNLTTPSKGKGEPLGIRPKKEQALTLKPIFNQDEINEIKRAWKKERFLKTLDQIKREQEEQRIRSLVSSDRARIIIKNYEEVEEKKYGSLSLKSISSKDDVIILTRYYVERFLGECGKVPDQMRQKITSLRYADFKKLSHYTIKSQFGSFQEAIIATFPTLKLHIFEFNVPANFWFGENGKEYCKEAIRWIVEGDTGILKEDPTIFRNQLTSLSLERILNKKNISGGILKSSFGKIQVAIINTYPELKFEEWEFHSKSWIGERGFQQAINATRWLVEDRLGLSKDSPSFREKVILINARHFKDAGLGGMLQNNIFHYSQINAIKLAYPELDLKEWEFTKAPNKFWLIDNHHNVKEAMRWLAEKKLKVAFDNPNFRSTVLGITQDTLKEFNLFSIISSTRLTMLKIFQISFPELKITEKEYVEAVWGRSQRKGFSPQEIFEEALFVLKNDGGFSITILQKLRRWDLIYKIYKYYPGRMTALKEKLNIRITGGKARRTEIPKNIHRANLLKEIDGISNEQKTEIVNRYLEFVEQNPDSKISILEFAEEYLRKYWNSRTSNLIVNNI